MLAAAECAHRFDCAVASVLGHQDMGDTLERNEHGENAKNDHPAHMERHSGVGCAECPTVLPLHSTPVGQTDVKLSRRARLVRRNLNTGELLGSAEGTWECEAPRWDAYGCHSCHCYAHAAAAVGSLGNQLAVAHTAEDAAGGAVLDVVQDAVQGAGPDAVLDAVQEEGGSDQSDSAECTLVDATPHTDHAVQAGVVGAVDHRHHRVVLLAHHHVHRLYALGRKLVDWQRLE